MDRPYTINDTVELIIDLWDELDLDITFGIDGCEYSAIPLKTNPNIYRFEVEFNQKYITLFDASISGELQLLNIVEVYSEKETSILLQQLIRLESLHLV